jgi:hypothetical protein
MESKGEAENDNSCGDNTSQVARRVVRDRVVNDGPSLAERDPRLPFWWPSSYVSGRNGNNAKGNRLDTFLKSKNRRETDSI